MSDHADTDADGDTAPLDPGPLAQRVVAALRDREATVALAESHTGGRAAAALVAVPGASAVLDRGLVTYGYGTKRELLGVPRETLDEHGSVSEPTAAAMAAGVRDTAGTTWGVSTTGVAGPDGGSPAKPVGTTVVGVAHAAPWETSASYRTATRRVLEGERTTVQRRAAGLALAELLAAVEGTEPDGDRPGTGTGSGP